MKGIKMRKSAVLTLILIVSLFTFVGCSSMQVSSLNISNSPSSDIVVTSLMKTRDDIDGDGIPDAGEDILGTNPYAWDTDGDGIGDKDDKTPNFTKNPIQETASNTMPVSIIDIRVVENEQMEDYLEIVLCNTAAENLTDFEFYYTIMDHKDGSVEGYYQKLSGFTLKKGSTKTLYFDNDITKAGHFFQNMNGICSTSSNGLVFEGQLHAAGYSPIDFSVNENDGIAVIIEH